MSGTFLVGTQAETSTFADIMAAEGVKQLLLCLTLLTSLALVCTDSQPWSPGSYPNPSTPAGIGRCGRRGVTSRICDPDGVISYESANVVEATIKDIQAPTEPYISDGCGQHSTSDSGFQVAVALMRKMMTLPGGAPAEEAAANFAAQIFDDWGIGEAACGNGVLLLLSIGDRQAYIYAGREAHQAATEGQLSRVIDDMRPLLRDGNYDAAVENAVVGIGLALAGADLRPHDDKESAWPLAIFLGIFSSVIGFTFWKSHTEKKQRRSAQAILDKLIREQATAVTTGRYPAVSCPICFADFETPPEPSAPPLPQDGDMDAQAGTSKDGADAPLLKRRTSKSRDNLASADEASEGDKKKPLALPCGHTFCAPCIQRWMANNTSCPVCRQPLEGASPSPPTPSGQILRRDMYEDELGFRLGGLNRMYPNIISQAMITHARSAVQHGQVINWDSIRQAQVSLPVRSERATWGSSGNSAPFFGGSSHGGGGIGGSW